MPLSYVIRTASYRKNSDDRVRVLQLDDALVCVVADGAGGVVNSAHEADLAVGMVQGNISAIDVWSTEAWVDLLVQIDRKICACRAPQGGGETTLVCAAVSAARGIVGASAGDSFAILSSSNGVVELTEGQGPYKKRRLGSGTAHPVGYSRQSWDGTVLVATDGLGYARTDRIVEVIALGGGDLDQMGDDLIRAVRLPGGSLMDDLALVLVRFRS